MKITCQISAAEIIEIVKAELSSRLVDAENIQPVVTLIHENPEFEGFSFEMELIGK